MSRSPTGEQATIPGEDYLGAWSELSQKIRQGRSFSGRERNCAWLNTRDGRFADISAACNLNLPDDGRTLATCDWDHDGDLDIWLTNRTGPRLRFLRNDVPTKNRSFALRLVGDPRAGSNLDAVGARVTVVLQGANPPRRMRTVTAGDAFLSQSSRFLVFGVPDGASVASVEVRWPDRTGSTEKFSGIDAASVGSPAARYELRHGQGSARRLAPRAEIPRWTPGAPPVPPLSDAARIRLTKPLALPPLEFRTLEGGKEHCQPQGAGRALLINLWATWCTPCLKELAEFGERSSALAEARVDVLALAGDGQGKPSTQSDAGPAKTDAAEVRAVLERVGFRGDAGIATTELVEALDRVLRNVIYRQRQLPIPTSFLMTPDGHLAAVYKGPVSVEQLVADVRTLSLPEERRRAAAVPFPGRWAQDVFETHPIAVGQSYIEGGYLGDAREYLETWLREHPAPSSSAPIEARQMHARRSADVHHLLARVLLRQKNAVNAVEHFRSALAARPGFVPAATDLAWLRATHPDAALRDGDEAERLARVLLQASSGDSPGPHDILAAALAEQGRFDEALESVQRAEAAARARGIEALVRQITTRRQSYERGEPWRQR